MLTRRNSLLGMLCLILLALELALDQGPGGGRSGSALFPDFVPDEVGAVEIQAAERSVHLDYKAGSWVVRERADFLAEQYLVESLLKRLPGLTDADRVASEISSWPIYGLGAERVHVQFTSKAKQPLLGFSVGRPAGEFQGSYILPDGQNAVYRSASLGLPQLDPTLWLNLHVVGSFDMTHVRRVELGFGDGRKLNLQLLDNGRWAAAGLAKSIAPAQVQQLMSFALNAVLRDVHEVEHTAVGLELPTLSLGFFLHEGVRRLDLGGNLGEGRAASSPDWGGPWVVEVPNSTAESLEGTAAEIYSALHRP